MCLIALAWKAHPRYALAVIANRDERHARPAAPAGFDPEHHDVYGGRDLVAGGSWLLASSRRRFSAVTNVRAGRPDAVSPRSRGALVHDFVAGDDDTASWLSALAADAGDFGRFNQLAWDGERLGFASNHPGFVGGDVAPGLHAMSNGAFDAPWPKSGHASRALSRWLDDPASTARGADDVRSLAPLLDALAESTPAPDDALPDTGVGLALERALSPAFVKDATYGTRCSTIVLVEADAIGFYERRFDPAGRVVGESMQVLATPPTPASR
ncbi:NRDE family protein [Marilutibacter aestuarii]|uniref:NRDE family protein n=1 Tax=Marilutibacter aestuarii TaxID=1706195 RepID=A0A508A5H7_9GAMM|nr:NRDE family protein [Lysobacter aestuarii]TQD42195.1 NRDE family protein [Lysobacter aestuarii]